MLTEEEDAQREEELDRKDFLDKQDEEQQLVPLALVTIDFKHAEMESCISAT